MVRFAADRIADNPLLRWICSGAAYEQWLNFEVFAILNDNRSVVAQGQDVHIENENAKRDLTLHRRSARGAEVFAVIESKLVFPTTISAAIHGLKQQLERSPCQDESTHCLYVGALWLGWTSYYAQWSRERFLQQAQSSISNAFSPPDYRMCADVHPVLAPSRTDWVRLQDGCSNEREVALDLAIVARRRERFEPKARRR